MIGLRWIKRVLHHKNCPQTELLFRLRAISEAIIKFNLGRVITGLMI